MRGSGWQALHISKADVMGDLCTWRDEKAAGGGGDGEWE